MDLITFKIFLDRPEAEIAKGLLSENGIECVISADDAGGRYPSASMGNVRLLVRKEDVEKVKEILEVLESTVTGELWEEDITAEFQEVKSTSPQKENGDEYKAWPFALIGFLILVLGILIYYIKKR